MKDHTAPKVKYDPGVALDKLNAAPLNGGGVVVESLNGGVLLNQPHDEGIPWNAPPTPKRIIVNGCSAITKAGTPCKARPITGEGICIGHSRVKTDDTVSDS